MLVCSQLEQIISNDEWDIKYMNRFWPWFNMKMRGKNFAICYQGNRIMFWILNFIWFYSIVYLAHYAWMVTIQNAHTKYAHTRTFLLFFFFYRVLDIGMDNGNENKKSRIIYKFVLVFCSINTISNAIHEHPRVLLMCAQPTISFSVLALALLFPWFCYRSTPKLMSDSIFFAIIFIGYFSIHQWVSESES